MTRMQAALLGAREVGFTVLSISISLVAVFIPLLFMGGQAGRLFREFAITLSAAVMISLVISLTTTPMMCAWLLKPGGEHEKPPGRVARVAERGYQWVLRGYEQSLDWALASKALVMLILLAVIGLNVYLFSAGAEGLLPAAGHRPAQRRHARRPEHLDQGDGREAAPGRRHRAQGPGGGHGGRLHRRRARRRRLHVREPEAREPAHRQGPRGDRAAAPAARARDRPAGVPEPGAGRALRRPREQLDLPVHAQERQRRRAAPVGAEAERRDEAAAAAHRRRYRPGRERRADNGEGRSRCREAARRELERDRLGAVQRVRPAPGRDDLHRAEPVPRRHGMGAGLHDEPERARRHLRAGDADRRKRRSGGRGRKHDGRGSDRHRRLRQPRAAQRLDRQRAEQHRDQPGAAVDDRALSSKSRPRPR